MTFSIGIDKLESNNIWIKDIFLHVANLYFIPNTT